MNTKFIFHALNIAFIHHPLLVVLSGQHINFDLFYDTNMMTKNERCKDVMINPKVFKLYLYCHYECHFKVHDTFERHKKIKSNNDI